jgi:hypothetical protein
MRDLVGTLRGREGIEESDMPWIADGWGYAA